IAPERSTKSVTERETALIPRRSKSMKRQSIHRIGLVGALAIAAPLAVMAQTAGGPGKDGPRGDRQDACRGHFHRGAHGHFHRTGMHRGHMLRGLDLTEAQRDKLF